MIKVFFMALILTSFAGGSVVFADNYAAAAKAATERQRTIDALKLQSLEDARAAAERDKQRGQILDAKKLLDAMDEAKRQQWELQNGAAQLEKQSDGMPQDAPEWDAKQNEAYQKALMRITKQQKQLEEEARKELEDAMKKR